LRSKYIILFLILCCTIAAKATHIVGGGFNIVWLHDSTYELHLRVLRDCINGQAPFNDPLFLGTFDKGTNQRIETITMTLDSTPRIEFIATKCLDVPGNLCVEVGYYTKIITLSPRLYNNNVGYYFSWERCCRNKIIQNIIDPEGAGMTFYMEIPPPRLIKNSSPKWHNNPRTLLCEGNPFSYNFNFIDPDGDSLYYSLVNPLQGTLNTDRPDNDGMPMSGPYPETQWAAGYDNTQQITGTPPLTIDHKTGQINVTPSVLSSLPAVFVSAIKVEEFRFGKKLGEVRLELQYTISECATNPFPIIQLVDTTSKVINTTTFEIHIPNKLCFDVVTTDNKDSLYVTINGAILNSSIPNKPVVEKVTVGNLKTTTRFCWQTTCDLTGTNDQDFTVEVTDNGCPLPKSTKTNFTVKLIPMPLINPVDILCMTLVDDKETIIYWGDSTGINNPYFYKYNLYRSTDNFNYSILDTFIDKGIREYNDKNTPNYSSINYSYFIRGVNKCLFEGATSDTMGTFDQLKYIPDQQKLITVTVEDNKRIKVLWPPTWEKDFAQYFLYKTTRDKNKFELIKSFLNKYDTVFYDNDVDVQTTSYCYHLIMKDTCGNIGPIGQPACSIVLKGISNPFEQTLSWLPFNYWENGTQCYNLYRRDTELPSSMVGVTNPSTGKFLDDHLNIESGKYNYIVEAKENETTEQIRSFNAVSRSNEVELIQSPLLHVPNAFTLNEDGINDDLGVHPVFVKDYQLKIFNRWGQLIFETTNKHHQWKGEGLNNNDQQTDVYVYVVTYTGWDESSHSQRGNITLLR
jgi:gliding motility-associated-like protein